jgi:hypothetical protein
MAATLLDVVSTNLVLVGIGLLRVPEEAEKFKTALDLDLRIEVGLLANSQTGMTEQSKTFMINRERTTLTLSPTRSTITREYPERKDLPRLATVATQAVECSDLGDQTLQAFGYNVEMVFDQNSNETAFHYIGNRLFGLSPGGEPAWTFEGGAGRLVFSDMSGKRTFAVEPRFGDETTSRVFLSLNLHKNERIIPTEQEIAESLNNIWEEAESFMNRLDERRLS